MKKLFCVLLMFISAQVFSSQERALDKAVVVHANPSEVWRAWTTKEGIREFLGVDSNIELRFGGRYELLFESSAKVGNQGSEGCQVLSFVPEKMLSFSWNAPPSIPSVRDQRTFVVINLEPSAAGTTVRLHHAGWGAGADWDKAYAYFDSAWSSVLDALKARFDAGPPRELPPLGKSTERDLAPLDQMATMIGGVWRGEVKGPDGPLVVEFRYRRHGDGKGVIGEGTIGKGSKHPLFVHSQFGWDPVAKAVYYFDTHDSETLYFGHVRLEDGSFVFTFSPIGELPQLYQSRARLVDHDTYQAIIRDDKGKDIVGFTLKRSKG